MDWNEEFDKIISRMGSIYLSVGPNAEKGLKVIIDTDSFAAEETKVGVTKLVQDIINETGVKFDKEALDLVMIQSILCSASLTIVKVLKEKDIHLEIDAIK